MASLVVNRGLQLIGSKVSGITLAPPTTAAIVSMTLDTKNSAFLATDATIAASTKKAKAFDATPTRTAQVISHITTFTTAEGNFLIRRISLHNLAAASVSSNSSSLVAGIDGQSITKTSAFTLAVTLKLSYTSS